MTSKSVTMLGMCCRKMCVQKSKHFINISQRFSHKYPPKRATPLEPSRYASIYRDLHGAIEEPTAAKDFVYALDKRERLLLRAELESFDRMEKQTTEEKAATKPTASQLKAGNKDNYNILDELEFRPDPTSDCGVRSPLVFEKSIFCVVATLASLFFSGFFFILAVALHNTIPFIGFGFLDNVLMILAGEYIELQFGAMLGISTMAAAALGNWFSDLAGVQTVHYIEKISSLYGVKAPALSPQQVDMSSTRWASNMGKAIGVSIGCIIGMFPLLFYKDPKDRSEEESPS